VSLRPAPSDPQQADRLHRRGGCLRGADRFAGLHRSSCADRIGDIGLAVPATALPVRAHHLDDPYAVRSKPAQQLPVANAGGRERLGAQQAIERIERGRDMDVLMRVNAARDARRRVVSSWWSSSSPS